MRRIDYMWSLYQILIGLKKGSSLPLTLYLLVLSADTFANSLDPDQVRHFVLPDQDPNCLSRQYHVNINGDDDYVNLTTSAFSLK